MSPSDYLSQIRINRAKEQLLTSRAPVKEIAAQVGFADEFYFSRKFKKTVGTAPSAFLGSKKSHMAIMNFPYVGHLLALGVVPSIGVYDQNRDRHRRELLGARLHYPLKRTKRFEAQLADYNLQALRESRPELIVCSDYDSEAYGLSTMQKMGPTVVIPWIYVMAEVGLATWLPTYLVQVRGLALTEGAFYLSGFYLVFTIGRLTAHRWIGRIGQEKAVLLCSLSAIVALGLAIAGSSGTLGFFIASVISFAAIFPTIAAIACQLYPAHTGKVLGFLFTASGIGSLLANAAIGAAASQYGMGFGFSLILIFLALVVCMGSVMNGNKKKHQPLPVDPSLENE